MKRWFELLKEKLNPSQLRQSKLFAPLFLWYDGLPPDQKNIAHTASIIAGVLFLLFLVYWGHVKVEGLREQIEAQNLNLKELSRYEEQFHEQTMALKILEREAKKLGADFSLLSALEQLAQSSQIGRESIESISPKQLPPGEYFIETEATVQLVRVTLRQLVEYFYKIETSPNTLLLKEVRVKPRFDNPQFLNVIFKVSAYKPKD